MQYGCLWMLYANQVWGAQGHVTKISQAKNGQKVDELPIYLVITDIDQKQFAIFEHTINHHSFGYVCLPKLENYFSCFASFFLLFLLPLSTFKPLTALYVKFERLKISGRTFVQQKSRVPGWEDPPQSGPPKF